MQIVGKSHSFTEWALFDHQLCTAHVLDSGGSVPLRTSGQVVEIRYAKKTSKWPHKQRFQGTTETTDVTDEFRGVGQSALESPVLPEVNFRHYYSSTFQSLFHGRCSLKTRLSGQANLGNTHSITQFTTCISILRAREVLHN